MTREDLIQTFPRTRYRGPGSFRKFLDVFCDTQGGPYEGVGGWTDVDAARLHDGPLGDIGGYLVFMPPAMWLHFLPAWMLVAAEFGVLATGTLTGLGMTLVPELLDAVFLEQDAMERLSLLNERQIGAVRGLGEILRSDPEVAEVAGYDLGEGIIRSMDRIR
jgi:hypothetical protein